MMTMFYQKNSDEKQNQREVVEEKASPIESSVETKKTPAEEPTPYYTRSTYGTFR